MCVHTIMVPLDSREWTHIELWECKDVISSPSTLSVQCWCNKQFDLGVVSSLFAAMLLLYHELLLIELR